MFGFVLDCVSALDLYRYVGRPYMKRICLYSPYINTWMHIATVHKAVRQQCS